MKSEQLWEETSCRFMQADTPDRAKLVRLRASLPQAQITSYTYQPMAGVTSITDPCGVVSYYEYDLLQRLNRQKDNYGRTIKAYDYRYSVNSFKRTRNMKKVYHLYGS